jgi:hypothetical protein
VLASFCVLLRLCNGLTTRQRNHIKCLNGFQKYLWTWTGHISNP